MENVLSRVVDALPGLVWTALPDGHVDFLNKRWFEYTGLGLDEARGRGWQTAIHPEDLSDLLERWRFIVASGEPREMEARLRRFDGEYRWFLVRTCALADASGQVVKWCGLGTDIDDRKRAEEALHARWWLSSAGREHHFRSVSEGTQALASLLTPGGEVQLVNRHVLEYFGATLEKLKHRAMADTVHPDDRPDVLAVWKGAVEAGRSYEVECRHRRADGVYRWFHVRGSPLRDTEERIVFWYLVQTDIDDRKRAEAVLAGENRLLELVASGRPLPVVLDSLCRLLDAMAEGCSSSVLLLDRTRKRVQQVVAPGLPSSYRESLVTCAVSRGEGPCGMAVTLKKQVIVSDVASDTRWDSRGWRALALAHGLKACWSTPILSLTGESLGTFAIYQGDVGSPTPFHQALIQRLTQIASIAIEGAQTDAELRQSEAFLAEAQQLSSTGSFLWRVGTDEFTWSEQLYRIYEFDQGVPVTHELIGTRDIQWANQRMDWALNDGRDFEGDYQLQMPDGSVKHLHFVARAARDRDGQLEYIGAVQDVTERRLSEEALANARSELAHVARVTSLGALTASIAHEVNQPLSGIVTNASTCLRMLAADPPNVDGARETARRTLRDANRASDVITRLRALFSKKAATTESVDLNEATREVMVLSRSELQRNRVVLRLQLADDLPPVMGDRVQLQQVILNLLLNASDAMSGVDDRPRQLVVRTERDEGDRVRLSVQDSGVGFEPQDAEKLFEAFYTTKSGGMGIGLSVSRSIIERHHGRLWAAPNDGPGVTFSFSIPRGPEDVTSARSLGAIQTPAASDTAHVMSHP